MNLHRGHFKLVTPFRISGSQIINQTSLHFKVKYSHDLIYRLFRCHLAIPRKQVYSWGQWEPQLGKSCVYACFVCLCVPSKNACLWKYMFISHAYQIAKVGFCFPTCLLYGACVLCRTRVIWTVMELWRWACECLICSVIINTAVILVVSVTFDGFLKLSLLPLNYLRGWAC